MNGMGGLHVSTWLNSFTTFISTDNIRSLVSHPILYLHTHIKNVTTSRFCQLHRKGLTLLLHLGIINQQGDHLCGLEGVWPVAATGDHHLLDLRATKHSQLATSLPLLVAARLSVTQTTQKPGQGNFLKRWRINSATATMKHHLECGAFCQRFHCSATLKRVFHYLSHRSDYAHAKRAHEHIKDPVVHVRFTETPK